MSFKTKCRIEFFVPYNRHQNCLEKSLLETFKFLYFPLSFFFSCGPLLWGMIEDKS